MLAFAEHAAESGWSNAALLAFLAGRGVPGQAALTAWPRGVRDIARALNGFADEATLETFAQRPPATMRELLLSRFEQNAALKRSVSRLAWSDLVHPLDTLARTDATARTMWICARRPGRGGRFDRWRLVCAYSLCVIVWLADGSPDLKTTRRAIDVAVSLFGVG